MKLSSDFVGTPLREYTTTINWRDIMNFAAATGDNNPLFMNDERDGGIVAPPMFCVAVTWPITERLWEYVDSDTFPVEVIRTQVHYTEHLRLHRLVRPDDRLTVRGKIAAIIPHRAGTHVIIRFDATDHNHTPVFTEHIGGLMRGVECEGEARGESDVPPLPRYAGKQEEGGWEKKVHIDPLLPYIYDGCTGIYFPIHTSVKFAHEVGLPGIILQGTATLALAAREITNTFAAGDAERIQSIACRFTDMVLPGTGISILSELAGPDPETGGVPFNVLNNSGKKAIRDGLVTLRE